MEIRVITTGDQQMGLEMAELVIDCEKEFGISIPDTALVQTRTVGDFYDLVMKLIRNAGDSELRHRPHFEQYAWDRVRYFCIRPQKDFSFITHSTRFIEDLGYQ